MRYQPGKSGNPQGRPKGSKDRRSLFRELIDPHKDKLAHKAVEMALGGNEAMMKLLLERILPAKAKEEALEESIVLNGSWEQQAGEIISCMTNGDITLAQGSRLMSNLKISCEIMQMTEMVKKIEALEHQIKLMMENSGLI